jgi:hypothetical protein
MCHLHCRPSCDRQKCILLWNLPRASRRAWSYRHWIGKELFCSDYRGHGHACQQRDRLRKTSSSVVDFVGFVGCVLCDPIFARFFGGVAANTWYTFMYCMYVHTCGTLYIGHSMIVCGGEKLAGSERGARVPYDGQTEAKKCDKKIDK